MTAGHTQMDAESHVCSSVRLSGGSDAIFHVRVGF